MNRGNGDGARPRMEGVFLLYTVWAAVIVLLVVPAVAEDTDDASGADAEVTGGGTGEEGSGGALSLVLRNLPLFAGAAAVIGYMAIFGYFASVRRKDGLRRRERDSEAEMMAQREYERAQANGTLGSGRSLLNDESGGSGDPGAGGAGERLVRGKRRANGEEEREGLRPSRRMGGARSRRDKTSKGK